MTVKKKTIVDELEVEFKDNNTPTERMRHKDSDGDGICDFIDNAYNKPQDRYSYREISYDDYARLKKAGYDVEHNCHKGTQPDIYILRYPESKAQEIELVIKPIVRKTVAR